MLIDLLDVKSLIKHVDEGMDTLDYVTESIYGDG